MAKRTGKDSGLRGVVGLADKRFGPGTVMQLAEDTVQTVDTISTGSQGLDDILGVGGLPRGRVIEIYGPESSGKTTLTLHAIAEAQRRGLAAGFIDAEHAIDPNYAQALGVQLDALLLCQPDCGEDGLEVADMMARSGEIGLIVIDSVAALIPRQELDGEMNDLQVGLQARMMGKALRKLTGVVKKTGTTLIFINQLRQKIGVTFGSGETTTGGNALKFYASVRLDIRRIATLKDGDAAAIGNRTRVRVVKNKVAPPFQTCEFDIMYGRGICRAGEALDRGLACGAVVKAGSWLSFSETRLGQGRERARAKLLGDPELLKALLTAVAPVGADAPAGAAQPAAVAA